jgi:hypothetical protein
MNASELDDDGNRKLKRAVATRLGRMVMEYSRLENELGLVLYGSTPPAARAEMALALRRADFSERLSMLRRQLGPHPPPEYAPWIREADAARRLRNRLIHGRWDFRDPEAKVVVNVRGDPFSDELTETPTTIGELDAQLEQVKSLRRRLASMRKAAPR